MTPANKATVERIERERRQREELLLLLYLAFSTQALNHARSALRIGADPVAAATAVILGSAAIHQPGIQAELAKLIAGTYAAGQQYAGEAVGAPVSDAKEAAVYGAAIATRNAQQVADTIARVIDGSLTASSGQTTQQRGKALQQAFDDGSQKQGQ